MFETKYLFKEVTYVIILIKSYLVLIGCKHLPEPYSEKNMYIRRPRHTMQL